MSNVYVVKVKSAAYDGYEEVHSEIEYRVASLPGDLPSADDDLDFLGFKNSFEGGATKRESYVCSEKMCLDKSSRKYSKFKDELAKSAEMRTAGGV